MNKPTVAYFSAEYAIADDMPIYAGGLGVLAADMVLEAGTQDCEFYAVGLVYHLAFTGDDPDQRPMTERLASDGFQVARDSAGKRLLAEVLVADRTVALQAWVKRWGRTQLILLDTNLSQNAPADRAICDRLYAADPQLQLAQEMCLGFGGVRVLELLGLTPEVYHLNEGHTAMAGLAVVLREQRERGEGFAAAVATVRPRLVGTKHTILAGAGILLDWGSVAHQLEPTLAAHGASIDDLRAMAGLPTGDYSDTKLLIELTRLVNGVSEIHVAEELEAHPQSRLITITNGVFQGRWAAANWGDDPLALDDDELWMRHTENRRRLFTLIREQTGVELDSDALTVVWSRRMAAYKRPDLLVSDMKRLAGLAHDPERPVQFVVSGRANPADAVGVELMQRVIATSKQARLAGRFAYVPRFNPVTAKIMVRGADVWLNTPIRGYEACGTSGMKASMNGALQFSTSDGWLDEVKIGPIGWRLPVDNPAAELYARLEQEIAPLFYERGEDGLPHAWIRMMRANMKLVLERFTAKRMLDDYYAKLYEPEESAKSDVRE
ncbi:MAG TPA: alpha-glucan family phosphorylase [Candidatus Saccharimonadia bacterium]|nr:alpha-glucan family phosphorylase [Candidatus Saccharimonadia bacterium]